MIPAVRNVKRQEAEPTNRRKEKSRVNLSQISVVAVVATTLSSAVQSRHSLQDPHCLKQY